jgi:anti-sigma regulatory factor (Ser/Thr protein kinase)
VDARAEFPPDLSSAAAARHFAEERLSAWGADDLLESTRLLVSELVINAVLHARTPADVQLRFAGGCLRVEVGDRSERPLARRAFSPSATTGRGLMILDALANRWGVETDDEGKVVWFELDSAAASAFADAHSHTAAPAEVRSQALPGRSQSAT